MKEILYKYIDWQEMLKNEVLSQKFINKYYYEFRMGFLIQHQKLSEKFLRTHASKFNVTEWFSFCAFQNISEKFIEDYIHKMNWELISEFHNFSEKFLKKHFDKIDKNILFNLNKSTPKYVLDKVKKDLDLLKEII